MHHKLARANNSTDADSDSGTNGKPRADQHAATDIYANKHAAADIYANRGRNT